MRIRESLPDDLTALEVLYPAAFPDEDLLPTVRDLETGGADVLSLVAGSEDGVAGHIAFTLCPTSEGGEKLALLAPLCVAPGHQKQGIGTALIGEGVRQLKTRAIAKVLVLGDPAYYGRFGFRTEKAIMPPYPLPEEWAQAWQSISLIDTKASLEGPLLVPDLWKKPELWGA